jgi:hypothetical protein
MNPQKEKTMLIKRPRLFGLVLLALFLPLAALAAELPVEPAVVVLQGKVHMESFLDEGTEKIARVPILYLDSPIDVAGDNFAEPPVKGVTKLQIAAKSDAEYHFIKTHLHQELSIRGDLYHAFNSHHFTEILIHATSVTTAKGHKGKGP